MTKQIQVSGSFDFETRRTWDQAKYGGLSERVLLNEDGSKSENLAIMKHGKITNVMSTAYYVFPNVDLDEILTDIAKEVGATQYKREKIRTKNWFRSNRNMLSDAKYGTRALINFKFDKVADITGKGDTVQFGFSGSNSEDGRGGALKIIGLNIRAVCDNLAYTFVPSTEIAQAEKLGIGIYKAKQYQIHDPSVEIARMNMIDAKADLTKIKFVTKHSKAVSDLDNLKDQIRLAVEKIKLDSDRVIKRYKELYKTKLNVHTARRIKEELPHSIVKDLNYIDYDKKTDSIKVLGNVKDWTVYNDLTEALTYATNRTYGSTIGKYKKLENIFLEDPMVVA